MRDEDRVQQQIRQTDAVLLGDRPLDTAEPLPAGVVSAFGAIRRRRQLLRSEAYRRHERELLDLTYRLQHAPPPGVAPGRRDFIRVVSWNIHRGIHLDRIGAFMRQHDDLRQADILMLNEVDLGMARSENRHVAAELAGQLGMGYVYGNSYLCLGFGDARDGKPRGENDQGLHGNAILSRFAFRRAENFSIEISKDKFHSAEKRLGHKKSLWAEVDTPLGPLPVVAVHLDAYASSAQRGRQLRDVLAKVTQRQLDDRVLLGGDLNTNTYDAKNVGQLCGNLARKLVRGGFPHAMHHYMHPYEIYERPVFDQLEAAGYDYRSFNAMDLGTTRYEVGSFDSESTVTEQLPAVAVRILRRKLRPWNGVAPLKVDWFFGRGLQVCQDAGDGASGDAAACCRGPTTIERPTVDGVLLSDHDPIMVDVRF